jgi:crossover junction endodeoxyribonuclease RuvC
MANYIGLDLSTKTGLVVLDSHGMALTELEIRAKGDGPERMKQLSDEIMSIIHKEEPALLAMEGFSYGSKGSGVDFQYGIGWIMRLRLHVTDTPFLLIAPTALKKFAGAKGDAKKDALAVDIYKRWKYEHKSDNVRDAYVLAQIARHIGEKLPLTSFQQDVIDVVLGNKKVKKRA